MLQVHSGPCVHFGYIAHPDGKFVSPSLSQLQQDKAGIINCMLDELTNSLMHFALNKKLHFDDLIIFKIPGGPDDQ